MAVQLFTWISTLLIVAQLNKRLIEVRSLYVGKTPGHLLEDRPMLLVKPEDCD
jgi:hypothetical protein